MAAPAEKDQKYEDAVQYWGYTFQQNKRPTEKLDRLLHGIAAAVSKEIDPNDSHNDLTPIQMSKFYRSVGGDYDTLFLDSPHHSIAFIYKSLGCLHSLQPSASSEEPNGNGAPNPYSSPTVPALKSSGFVTWQSIQILLDPEEHVPYIQSALRDYDVVDPFTSQPFPKLIPIECFPERPDQHMIAWHEGVGERLRIEAQEAQKPRHGSGNESRPTMSGQPMTDRPMTSTPAETPVDERADAAAYFATSHSSGHSSRHKDDRSTILRNLPTGVRQGGKAVALTVKNIANAHLWSSPGSDRERDRESRERERRDGHRRRRDEVGSGSAVQGGARRRSDGHPHPHAHFADDVAGSDDDATDPRPKASRMMPPPARPSHVHHASMPHSSAAHTRMPPRRNSGRASPLSPSSSDQSMRDRQPSPRRRPRRHRSHEPESSPRDEFRHYERQRERQARGSGGDRPGSGPANGVRYGAPRPRRRSSGYAESPNAEREYYPRERDRGHGKDRPVTSNGGGYFPNPSDYDYYHKSRTTANSGRPRSENHRERPISSSSQQTPYLSSRGSGPTLRREGQQSPGAPPPAPMPPSASDMSAEEGLSAGDAEQTASGSTGFRDPFGAGSGTGVTSPLTDPETSARFLDPNGHAPPLRRRSDGGHSPSPMPPPLSGGRVSGEEREARGRSGSEREGRDGRRRERPVSQRIVTGVDGVSGRRYPSETLWR